MSKPNEVKLGIIGLGSRGHGMMQTYSTMKRCRITALCDKYDTLVKKAYGQLGQSEVSCYTDLQTMLKEADIDAVFIAVEPENNADIVCQSLDAGKHAMCDVPLAYTMEECWRVVTTVERTGLRFQMAEQVRYHPFALAWKQMVQEGRLGKALFGMGQYLHGLEPNFFWMDSETGERLTWEQAKTNPRAKKSRIWYMPHAILYLPHELSPFLSILDDRVAKVTGMGTRKGSYYYEDFPYADIEVALMHTEKDTVLQLATGFTVQSLRRNSLGCHWYHLMGTKGLVETNRSNADRMKMWFEDSFMKEPVELNWEYDPFHTSMEAMASGHGGMDYYPMAYFLESILDDKPVKMDVYKAVDTAAPAILAAQSIDEDGSSLTVPDFRPSPKRKKGQMPIQEKGHGTRDM